MKMPKWLQNIIGDKTPAHDGTPVETVVAEVVPDKVGASVNLRNPAQRKVEDVDPITKALAGVAADSLNKDLSECDSIFLTCKCGKKHFRHTGYLETIVPFVSGDGGKICSDTHPVKTCCSCRKSYVAIGSKVYDVTKEVDMKAWEKFEKEAHKSTGPGGEC